MVNAKILSIHVIHTMFDKIYKILSIRHTISSIIHTFVSIVHTILRTMHTILYNNNNT